jgi:methyl-accepting chemotaxis protein
MDFSKAIHAHVEWKAKLTAYIEKPDRSLSPAKVGNDHNCELGQWIYGEGQKFARDPEFRLMVSCHERFHKAAASVISRADSGVRVAEETALGAKSEYADASSAVVGSLMRLKKQFAG